MKTKITVVWKSERKNSNLMQSDSAFSSWGTRLRLAGIHFILFLSYGLHLISVFTSTARTSSHLVTILDSDRNKKKKKFSCWDYCNNLPSSGQSKSHPVLWAIRTGLCALKYLAWLMTFSYTKQVILQSPAHLLYGQYRKTWVLKIRYLDSNWALHFSLLVWLFSFCM